MPQAENVNADGPPSSPAARGAQVTWSTWARGHLVAVALVSVLVAGVAVLTTVAFGGDKATAPSGHPAGTAQAATITKGSRWLAGSGAKSLTAVNTDLGRVMAGERAGSRGAATKAAGARLAADAAAALSGPMPPADAAVYRSALADLERAGSLVAGGQSGRAAPLLEAGQAELMRVTSAADQPVASKAPAIPDPGRQ